jgi:hypothetical protein
MKKNAKAASAIIIGTILTLTLLMSAGETKAAFQRDWSGDVVGYPGPDVYCECDHTDWQHSDDCMAGLSMQANYWTNYPPYAYGWVVWDWIAQVGYGYSNAYGFSGNPYCLGQIMPVNTQTYQNYYSFYNTNAPSYDSQGQYATNAIEVFPWQSSLTSVNALSSSYFYQIGNPSHVIYVAAGPSSYYYQVMTASGPQQEHIGESSVEVDATADVAATPTQAYTRGTNPTISWVCADDYGSYYCYITTITLSWVTSSGTSTVTYNQPNGNFNYVGDRYSISSTPNTGSITFNNIQTAYHVIISSTPYYYPVTFNVNAHNDNYGDMLVNSWTEYHVAWEEVGGPHYSHGSDLNGGGGEDYFVDSAIDDPWGQGTDYFSYAMAHNWGGGSESYYYSIPLNVLTFVWGNTVDLYYNWQGYGMNGASSNIPGTNASAQPTLPNYPLNFVPPTSTPYVYNSTTNTYIPAGYP